MLHCMWWGSQMQRSRRLRGISSYFWRCRKSRKFEIWIALRHKLAQTQAQRPRIRTKRNHAAKSAIEAASEPASLPARQAASQATRHIGTGRQTTHQPGKIKRKQRQTGTQSQRCKAPSMSSAGPIACWQAMASKKAILTKNQLGWGCMQHMLATSEGIT